MDFSDLLLLLKVNELIEKKDFEGANEVVDELLGQNPDNASILFAKALCLDAMGDFQEALKMAEKAKNIDSDVVPDEFYNSVSFKVNNAVKRTSKRSEESKLPSILNSGSNLIDKGEFNKAKLFFDRALGIQSENIEALVGQAYCFDRLGMKTRAHELIDDVDRFKNWQVQCINSFLKVSTSPCAWKLSSSLPYQTLSTEDDTFISGTDLKNSILNDESVLGKGQKKERIDELFDAIFKSRLKEHNVSHQNMTDIRSIFGKMDLERDLKDVIKQSLKQSLKAEYNEFVDSGDKYYTDFWLKKKCILRSDDSRKKFDKYRVNATFAIVKANNLEESFRYSSYEVIRSLCAGSPRHFLRICDCMWPSILEKLEAIGSSSPIKKEKQNLAIRKASNELIEIIDKEWFNRNIHTSCKTMCDRLGNLFILLTNDENSLRRSQECMSVSFNISDIKNNETQKNLLKVIDKLTMLEVIKVRRDDEVSTIYQVGLNPMLTPCYFISFRNPFLNKITVNAEQFYDYLTCDREMDPRQLAIERVNYMGPSLFDSINYE